MGGSPPKRLLRCGIFCPAAQFSSGACRRQNAFAHSYVQPARYYFSVFAPCAREQCKQKNF
ncbi:MAG: hypothetical protein DBY30_08195 [Verrucomicrobia bacterium]|nr:MAG: hypothetical protein DBY30_08195 [Verrucomicrobiota bacterium]